MKSGFILIINILVAHLVKADPLRSNEDIEQRIDVIEHRFNQLSDQMNQFMKNQDLRSIFSTKSLSIKKKKYIS